MPIHPLNLGGSPQNGLFPRGGMPLGPSPVSSALVSDANKAGPTLSDRARDFGVADALASPIRIESGTIAEAIAEMLAAGLHGRAASRDRQAGLDEETRAQKLEDGERSAYSDALNLSLDPSLSGADRTGLIARALGGANPQAGFEYQQAQQPDAEAQQLEAIIAQLPPDQQALARLNPQAYVAGIMRHRYPPPSQAQRHSDALDADEWEAF